MASNEVFRHARTLSLPVGVGVVSGQAVKVGALAGVADTSSDADGYATVVLEGVFRLAVTGAAAPGTAVYLTNALALRTTSTSSTYFGVVLDSKDATAADVRVLLDACTRAGAAHITGSTGGGDTGGGTTPPATSDGGSAASTPSDTLDGGTATSTSTATIDGGLAA